MCKYRRGFALVLVVVLLTTVLPLSAMAAAKSSSGIMLINDTSVSEEEWEVLRLVNEHRMSMGLSPLSTNDTMQKVANQRAYELTIAYDANHMRPDGRKCYTVFDDYYTWYKTCGENLAYGYRLPFLVVGAWLDSPNHKANIEKASFTHMGVGYTSEDTIYWSQEFLGDSCEYTKISLSQETLDCLGEDLASALEEADITVTLTCSKHGTCTMPLIAAMCSGYNRDKMQTQKIKVQVGKVSTTLTVPYDCPGHVYDAGKVIAPTCQKEGYTEYTCTICAESYKDHIEPAVAHSYAKGKCTFCGAQEPGNGMSAYYLDMPTKGNWAYAGIDYCIAHDLMTSTSSSELSFDPNGAVTRAQLVTILYRVEGSPKVKYTGRFTDVPKGKWYTDPIEWAAEKGVVTGVGDGKFDPNGKITREQIATILYRYTGSPESRGSLVGFADQKAVGGYAKDAMVWATSKKLITGIKSGTATVLAPKDSASRAQIAAIIMRYLTEAA